jgi:DNA polymerase delta subunit 3
LLTAIQRGTKRKSTGALLSDSDSEKSDEDEAPPKSKSKSSKAPPKPLPTKEKSSARVKKGVIFSSDEDDDEEIERAPKKRLQKGRKMVDRESDEDEEGDGGEAERSLRAMMDIDDGAFFLFYFLFSIPISFCFNLFFSAFDLGY